ncbi:putative outermembrane protein [hydrothermal vent metagenome]|uniref:Putative outermembrane protein n=1 Tax=hydrothermal vent metagenome TaxID=652676 RepID=A0A3B0WUH4_9ZZZZ
MVKRLIFSVFAVNLLGVSLLYGAVEPDIGFAGPDSSHLSVEKYIERARQLKLAEQVAWLNLLHYKKTGYGGLESQVDDEAFYLAKQGAVDPQAELEASLRRFFSHQPAAHPQCRFPARLHWLNRQLDFQQQLPSVDCNKFNRWKEKYQVKQLTLLFPTMYLDNPASMFGHTFIRFDREDGNQLLSQTLSYAAAHGGSDSVLLYSWKGITGGYAGRFFINPYYETLEEYSDIEQRDIWEYTLNLNAQEIEQLVRHIWELRGMHFEYYFFRENCAYRLLSLLDVAREGIDMSMSSHPLYAIPVDTVRDIERAGLISSRHYRPSANSKIVQMSQQIDRQGRELAFSVANKNAPVESILRLPDQADIMQSQIYRRQKILQLADEILNQKKITGAETDELQLKLLSVRSKLPAATQQQIFNFVADAPESAHSSARLQLSAGERAHQRFYTIGLRPAFHDILDASRGFNNGASISLFDARLRWYKAVEKLELAQLNLFSMRSLVPVASWATPLSRRISFQFKRRDFTPEKRISEIESQLAAGYTTGVRNFLAYAMLTTQFDYATELKNNHALYAGADMGIRWAHSRSGQSLAVSWQTEISYQNLQQLSGEAGDIQKINVGVQLDLMRDHAIRFEYEYIDYAQFDVREGRFSYLVYF